MSDAEGLDEHALTENDRAWVTARDPRTPTGPNPELRQIDQSVHQIDQGERRIVRGKERADGSARGAKVQAGEIEHGSQPGIHAHLLAQTRGT